MVSTCCAGRHSSTPRKVSREPSVVDNGREGEEESLPTLSTGQVSSARVQTQPECSNNAAGEFN